jgi:hypothetical protein
MKKYTNAQICEMLDNDEFKHGDKIYAVIAEEMIDIVRANPKLYSYGEYWEYDENSDYIMNAEGWCWHPEKGTMWTINEYI